MKRIYIEKYRESLKSKVCFYTVRFEDEAENETDKFFKRFQDTDYLDDLQIIAAWIKQIELRGADDRYFRFENNASAGPRESSNLRIYCIRCSNETIILDGGGIKNSKIVQDSPDAYKYFNLMNRIDILLREKIKDKDIYYNNKNLEGELYIDI